MKTDWKKWARAAGIRAIKTFCQSIVATIGCAVIMQDVDWLYCLSAAVLAMVLSMLTSVAGLPELDGGNF